ncbi:copper chaperone PCu(A)C [Pseudomonas sp.]|jgi:periplasmic copper chaperone A|uniref:copper chaperone PCu(A)C n=1 Tax=Pseudomonas sp. TaxID=306 RepID=UPI00272ADC81|nr:copper chaperone PCu(A)C [Pseudomonas sp.]
MKRSLPWILVALFAAPAISADFDVADIRISDPWSRAVPPVAPTGAAYLTIHNRGAAGDRLIGVQTPAAGHAELHEHVHQDGLMKMQKLESISIDAGEEVSFEPGGYHVMLFDLKQPLTEGTPFPLTLHFEKAGSVELEVEVRAPGATGNPRHSDDHHHHH